MKGGGAGGGGGFTPLDKSPLGDNLIIFIKKKQGKRGVLNKANCASIEFGTTEKIPNVPRNGGLVLCIIVAQPGNNGAADTEVKRKKNIPKKNKSKKSTSGFLFF